jgi:hypothetical protein
VNVLLRLVDLFREVSSWPGSAAQLKEVINNSITIVKKYFIIAPSDSLHKVVVAAPPMSSALLSTPQNLCIRLCVSELRSEMQLLQLPRNILEGLVDIVYDLEEF